MNRKFYKTEIEMNFIHIAIQDTNYALPSQVLFTKVLGCNNNYHYERKTPYEKCFGWQIVVLSAL